MPDKMTELDMVRRVTWAWKESGVEEKLGATGNHCIYATRVALEVLGELRIQAHALPCAIAVRNADAVDAQARGLPLPDWPPTAWSVGVDPDAPATPPPFVVDGRRGAADKHWQGHLIVEGAGWIADFSAVQFSRPLRNMRVRAWAAPVPQLDEDATGWSVDQEGGVNIKVYPRRELAGWRNGSAWRGDPPGDLVAGITVLALQGP